ncbi:MAG TPA: FHA domain-containing protein [Thermoanaerobaculia bacterium]|nr:FHA domain-containing protein [Thermoanaerobaculia bacterium]
MADKRCENGHFIDESWDLCPYCPAEEGEADKIPIIRPNRAPSPESRTAAPAVPTAPRPAVAPPPPTVRRETSPVQAPPMERTVAAQKITAEAPANKRYVVGWLVGLSGASRGQSYEVRVGRNVLGRDRRSDIVVSDDQASAHHADLVFRPEEKRFILMDHNSTNGTYVNEVEIEPRRDLVSKDIVRIGSQRYLFMPLCDENFYWDGEGALK